MKALVTGAAGYIGSVLCKILTQEGYEVTALDLVVPKHRYYTNFLNLDYANISLSLPWHGNYDIIFHLAANSLLGPSVYDPLAYYENNVGGLVKFLQNLRTAGNTAPIIFASSAATYGSKCNDFSFIEEEAGATINPYGSTKYVGEMILREACKAYGLKAYSMRFFNVAGAYGDVGQAIDQPHILTKMCLASLTNNTFMINGNSYNTYDGTCVRDYIHVIDVCYALIDASNDLLINKSSGHYDAFNVCSGNGTSNLELTNLFRKYYPLPEVGYNDSRPGDPDHLVGDTEKLKTIYKTSYSYGYQMKSIIESHYEYIKRQHDN
jgi:UDP-glucose 4-epimerase